MKTRKRIEWGKHIVSDPEICHGKLTFQGTRILVDDVLQMLAKGWEWERIASAYNRSINHEAIAEAIELARVSMVETMEKRQRAA